MSKIYKDSLNSKELFNNDKYFSRIMKTLYYADLKAAETDDLSLPLTELASEIFSEPQKKKTIDRLHYDTAAELCRYSCISTCSLILAMIYFERLKAHNIDYVEKMSPSDLFLISLVVSSKFLWDNGEIDDICMDEWAKSSNKTSKEIITLEKEFLNAIDWKVYVSQSGFLQKLNEIEMKLAKKQGIKRGYFTYTEIEMLLATIEISDLINCLISIWTVFAITYVAALVIISGPILIITHISGANLHLEPATTGAVISIEDNISVNENVGIHLPPCNETESELNTKLHYVKSKSNALNMFSASVLLASIKSNQYFNSTDYRTNIEDNKTNIDGHDSCQCISWDWWNVPVMNWLTNVSQIMAITEIPFIKYFIGILETMVANEKYMYRENHICKATKTRIQDQMETSWHIEWTSTIENGVEYFSVYNLDS